MKVGVKICGLTTRDAVETATEEGARYLGFVFFPASPRHVEPEKAATLAQGLPPTLATVAVTVDADDNALEAIMRHLKPQFIQCHGSEDTTRMQHIKQRFKVGIIRAIKVRSADDVAGAGRFSEVADHLLFDAKAPETGSFLPGGNGLSFDWQLLNGRNFAHPWFLSGGINEDNVQEAVRLSGAALVDVSSSIESAPGIKSPERIRSFMNHVAAIP